MVRPDFSIGNIKTDCQTNAGGPTNSMLSQALGRKIAHLRAAQSACANQCVKAGPLSLARMLTRKTLQIIGIASLLKT